MLSSPRATAADDVLKLGYSSVIFVDLGVNVDGTYYCDDSCCLPYLMSLVSLYFRKQCSSRI